MLLDDENPPVHDFFDHNYQRHGFDPEKPFAFFGDTFPRPFEDYLCFHCLPVPLACFLHCLLLLFLGAVELEYPGWVLGGYTAYARSLSNIGGVLLGFVLAVVAGVSIYAGHGTPKEICYAFLFRLAVPFTVVALDLHSLWYCEEWFTDIQKAADRNGGFFNEEMYNIAHDQFCIGETVKFAVFAPAILLLQCYMVSVHFRCQVLFDRDEETVHKYERHAAEVFEAHDLVLKDEKDRQPFLSHKGQPAREMLNYKINSLLPSSRLRKLYDLPEPVITEDGERVSSTVRDEKTRKLVKYGVGMQVNSKDYLVKFGNRDWAAIPEEHLVEFTTLREGEEDARPISSGDAGAVR
ncbi:unnamed protein product [Amoebophrya sp. A120]|nr:unnamed protein product [Amoebophrya sp. A120]|eukprot:GSA120T00002199001.1